MLINKCIHPEIIRELSFCGHGDRILIADGNYPLASKTGDACKVYLGLSPGMPTVPDTLAAILSCIKVEAATVMMPRDTEPEIFEEFRAMLPAVELQTLDRFTFYQMCEEKNVRLAISTGEMRTFANILITVAVS